MNDALASVWPVFEAESREQLAALASGVLDLERTPSDERVAELRRLAHSLKGSAASLGVADLEVLAHAAEDLLASAGDGRPLSPAAIDALLAAFRAADAALAPDLRGRVEGLPGLLARLGAGGGAGGAPAPAPAAPARAALDALAADLAEIVSADGAERATRAARARARAEELAGTLVAQERALATRLAADAAEIERGGDGFARALARAAAGLAELRAALERPRAPAPEPVQAAPAGTGDERPAPRPERSVRVDAARLDTLATLVDDLLLGVSRREHRGRELLRLDQTTREALRLLEQGLHAAGLAGEDRPRALAEGLSRLAAAGSELGRLSRDVLRDAERERLSAQGLRGGVQDLRMVPVQPTLAALGPAVRELAARLGKQVAFRCSGGEVRLDRRVLDELRAPLQHLVRNAVDHGVETPEARLRAGKPAEARVEVRVEAAGGRVLVTVEDDGAGLSPAALRTAAIRRGLVSAGDAARMSDADAIRLAFSPGLSTAAEVTQVSGRGVGLDVVADLVRRLGGTVDTTTEPGRGARFALALPLTITGSKGLLVRAAGGVALVPYEAVERVVLVTPEDLATVAGVPTVVVDGDPIPYTTLARAVGLAATASAPPGGAVVALVVSASGRRAVLAVDGVLGEHAMAVIPLGRRLAGARHLSGAAVLEDGRIVAVLHPTELLAATRAAPATAAAGPRRARVVVADDSVSTRFAVKSILELAGYEVLPAADGEEALALARSPGCDLVVSDVQMPGLDGLGLTRRLRADPALSRVPVILVTSLGSPEDRAAGLQAGADGYLVKRDVQQGRLLELVRQLVPGGR